MRTLGSLIVSSLLLFTMGCEKADPDAAKSLAGCESPNAAQLALGPNMLPGNACLNCHRTGGQASEADALWSVAGTVYSSNTSGCGSGAVGSATVEILNADGSVQFKTTTNEVGNFFATTALKTPFRARVTKGSMMREMMTPQITGNCASCHAIPAAGGAPGRIFLN